MNKYLPAFILILISTLVYGSNLRLTDRYIRENYQEECMDFNYTYETVEMNCHLGSYTIDKLDGEIIESSEASYDYSMNCGNGIYGIHDMYNVYHFEKASIDECLKWHLVRYT